ncbi:Mitogen-activated protein kinase 6, partial [Pristimantis euphronides]
MVNLAQLGALNHNSWDSPIISGEDCFLIDQFCCEVRKDDHVEKENAYTGYLDNLFGKKEEAEVLEPEPTEDEKVESKENDEGILSFSGDFILNKQLDCIGIPQFQNPLGSPLKSIQATLTPSVMKSSPQIPRKTYSSILKHL